MEGEFGVSSNAVRQELNKLEEAGVISSEFQGNKKLFTANRNHPLFDDLQRILMKTVGIDKILEQVITRLGDLESVYVTGSLAKGIDTNVIDLHIIGNVDEFYLDHLIKKVEKMISKNIRITTVQPDEWDPDKLYKLEYITIYDKIG